MASNMAPNMASTTKLRSFSYKRLFEMNTDSAEFQAAANDIVNEFKTIGFLRLENIPAFSDEEFLNEIKWFHNLPFEEKMKMSLKRFRNENENEYRGYMPLVNNIEVRVGNESEKAK